MNPLVYHIASGQAFFSGLALLLTAVLCSMRAHAWLNRIAAMAFGLGVIAIAISSTPLPYSISALALVVTGFWIVSAWKPNWRKWSVVACCFALCAAAAWEATYVLTPKPQPAGRRSSAIIGDSVTSGTGERETWPYLLAQRHDVKVQDLSAMGATTASALKRVSSETIDAPVVVLEIGGNDLLGRSSAANFRDDLDELLAHLKRPGRQIIMLELPLLPLKSEYGRAQRSLARRHGVLLVPKRVFLSVLAPKDSTFDTIHLTPVGHQRMEEAMWQVLAQAYEGVPEADSGN